MVMLMLAPLVMELQIQICEAYALGGCVMQ